MTLKDFLTDAELARAIEIWHELKGTGRFAAEVERQLIAPNMARINQALGQENHPRYLAYAVEFVLTECEHQQPQPGYLWEMAEDRCQTCGRTLGFGVRFLHVGRCDTCLPPTTH